MKQYICEFMERYCFLDEARKVVWDSYDKVASLPEFTNLLESFYVTPYQPCEYFREALHVISEKESISVYTLYLVYYICLSNYMKREYERKSIDEEVFYETVEDIRCKLVECHEMEEVWGVISFAWYYDLFHLKTFGMGRLQYHMSVYDGDAAMLAGRMVKADDAVIYIHIPSSGKPFDRAARMDSYEKAFYFYRDYFTDKTPIFCCISWLLNPENKMILGEKSNVSSFLDDFKIVEWFTYPDNRNMWRIFGKGADLPAEQLPRNTYMQKRFADWIARGHRLGGGKGLFIYDPVNKTTLK